MAIARALKFEFLAYWNHRNKKNVRFSKFWFFVVSYSEKAEGGKSSVVLDAVVDDYLCFRAMKYAENFYKISICQILKRMAFLSKFINGWMLNSIKNVVQQRDLRFTMDIALCLKSKKKYYWALKTKYCILWTSLHTHALFHFPDTTATTAQKLNINLAIFSNFFW